MPRVRRGAFRLFASFAGPARCIGDEARPRKDVWHRREARSVGSGRAIALHRNSARFSYGAADRQAGRGAAGARQHRGSIQRATAGAGAARTAPRPLQPVGKLATAGRSNRRSAGPRVECISVSRVPSLRCMESSIRKGRCCYRICRRRAEKLSGSVGSGRRLLRCSRPALLIVTLAESALERARTIATGFAHRATCAETVGRTPRRITPS